MRNQEEKEQRMREREKYSGCKCIGNMNRSYVGSHIKVHWWVAGPLFWEYPQLKSDRCHVNTHIFVHLKRDTRDLNQWGRSPSEKILLTSSFVLLVLRQCECRQRYERTSQHEQISWYIHKKLKMSKENIIMFHNICNAFACKHMKTNVSAKECEYYVLFGSQMS